MKKAAFKDAVPGTILYRKDHGAWQAITVVEVGHGEKGHKVSWTDADGNPGKDLLTALYRQPKD